MISQRHLCLLIFALIGTDSCMRKKARIDVACPEARDVTTAARQTTALVTWHRSDFTIHSTYPIRGIYQTVPIYGASAEVVTSLGEGVHHVGYRVVDETGAHDSCTFTVTVRVLRCSRLEDPQHGRVHCDANNIHGSECIVTCNQGYQVAGNQSLVCLPDGTWSSHMPYCRAATCPDPGTPLLGFRRCTSLVHTYNSECNFGCNDGYILNGTSKIICIISDDGVTRWSDSTPICKMREPPTVDICPETLTLNASGSLTTIVEKAEVRFLTSDGHPATHVCSHFGNQMYFPFTIGRHTVICTAFDQYYIGNGLSFCQFDIIIEATPCRPLPPPLHGHLLCTQTPQQNCQLHCHHDYYYPWSPAFNVHCDATGQWNPIYFVPSCVHLQRPTDIALDTEMVYTSSQNCSDPEILKEISDIFLGKVKNVIRDMPYCTDRNYNCIIKKQVAECRFQEHPYLPESRSRRYIVLASVQDPGSSEHSTSSHHDDSQTHRFYDVTKRRSSRRQNYVIAIKFQFKKTIIQSKGVWPDEYHTAVEELMDLFYTLENEIIDNGFEIEEYADEGIRAVRNGLTHADRVHTKCTYMHMFQEERKLCVPCGAGTFLNLALEDCELCPLGQYQPEMASSKCQMCPPGTTTFELGANNISQCIEINECASNPCMNGGLCEDGTSSFVCICTTGFAGVHCEEQVFDCVHHACRNGGTCIPQNITEYECACQSAYFGEYCQFHPIQGSWGNWAEWSACSESCEGGVQTRMRDCDSPPPSGEGEQCLGSDLEERVCNDIECPKCARLRRPYGGSLMCTVEDEHTSCTISCPPGYAFSGPTLPVYTCGPNTSYLWPHQSPDNPNARIHPSCMETTEPVAEEYSMELTASTSAPCTASTHAQISETVQKRAVKYTRDMPCFQDGSCMIELPRVAACAAVRRKRRSTNSTKSDKKALKIELLVLFDHKLSNSRGRSKITYESVGNELSTIANSVRSSRGNTLYLKSNDTKISLDLSRARYIRSPVCSVGSMPVAEDDACVDCGAGTFYSRKFATCLPCDVGTYQLLPRQLECTKCDPGKTTYGRGAKYRIECYDGIIPPDIPDDTATLPTPSGECTGCGWALAICVPLVTLILLLILGIAFYKRRKSSKKKRYKLAEEATTKDEAEASAESPSRKAKLPPEKSISPVEL